MKKQHGQSLVEVGILLAFVIAPLMLLLPYFSKVIEARHYNDMSARYIAFEKTVWLEEGKKNYSNSGQGRLAIKQTDVIKSEVPNRLFGKLSTPIDSRPVDSSQGWNSLDDGYASFKFTQAKSTKAHQSLFAAYNPNEENEAKHRFFEVKTSHEKPPGDITALLNRALSLLEIGGTEFNDKGFFKGQSELQIASHLLLEDEDGRNSMSSETGREKKRESEFEIAMNSELYVLADGWNVGGPRHNIDQVKGLVPSNLFDNAVVNTLRNFLSHVPIAKHLNSRSLKFGHVDIEELPLERYREDIPGDDTGNPGDGDDTDPDKDKDHVID